MLHCGSCYCSCLILIPIQLKADILSKAIANVSTASSDVLSNGVEASFDPDPLLTVNANTNTNMLDILLNSIGESPINERNPVRRVQLQLVNVGVKMKCINFYLELTSG
jgi:hypothetical protein